MPFNTPPQRPLPIPPVHALDLPLTPPTPVTTLSSSDNIIVSSESIQCWALHVQPGSPAPRTPPSASDFHPNQQRQTRKQRRPSVSRLHLNLSTRRPGGIAHGRARSGSASFLNILDTPSTGSALTASSQNHQHQHQAYTTQHTPATSKTFDPTARSQQFDLTNLGYTSVFVRLPYTPGTPAFAISSSNNISTNTTSIANSVKPTTTTTKPSSTLSRIRSLSILRRPRSKSVSNPTSSSIPPVPPMPALPIMFKPSSSNTNADKKPSSALITQRKKALYPSTPKQQKPKKHSPAKHTPLPPSLANELALMQFIDGGSMENNIKRVMESQAKQALPAGINTNTKINSTGGPVLGDVHRDAKGGIWWDKEEEMEYAHLLASSPTTISSPSPSSPGHSGCSTGTFSPIDWVKFNGKENSFVVPATPFTPFTFNNAPRSAVDFRRRGSWFSVEGVVKPAEEEGLFGQFMRIPLPTPVASNAAAAISRRGSRGSRPRSPGSRGVMQREQRERSRSRGRMGGRSRRGTVASISPLPVGCVRVVDGVAPHPAPAAAGGCVSEVFKDGSVDKDKGKGKQPRRRPAPLELVPHKTTTTSSSSSSLPNQQDARKTFLEESFIPTHHHHQQKQSQPPSAVPSFVDVALASVPGHGAEKMDVDVGGANTEMEAEIETEKKGLRSVGRTVKKKASRMALGMGFWRK